MPPRPLEVAPPRLLGLATSGAGWGGASCWGAGFAAAAPAPASTTANTSPGFTVSPSWCMMRASTPDSSAEISVLTFSVSSSTTASPAATASPSFFSQ